MIPGGQAAAVAALVLIAVLVFFVLAAAFGADTRPYESRPRRWL